MDYNEYVEILLKQAEKQAKEKGVSVVQMMSVYQKLYDIMMFRIHEHINKEYQNKIKNG